MASSKSEGKWFGLVVMSSPEEALLCIENVNNTQFQDDVITVEFVRYFSALRLLVVRLKMCEIIKTYC